MSTERQGAFYVGPRQTNKRTTTRQCAYMHIIVVESQWSIGSGSPVFSASVGCCGCVALATYLGIVLALSMLQFMRIVLALSQASCLHTPRLSPQPTLLLPTPSHDRDDIEHKCSSAALGKTNFPGLCL